MNKQIIEHAVRQIFSFSTYFDALWFVLSILILFYRKKDKTLKNALILTAHAVGLFLSLFTLDFLARITFTNSFLVSYLPKAVLLVLYLIFFNDYKIGSRIILGVLIYSLNHVFIEIGGCIQAVFNANTPNNLPVIVRCSCMPLTTVVAIILRIFNVDNFRSVPRRSVVEICAYGAMGIVLAVMRGIIMPYLIVFEKTEQYLYGVYPQLYITIALFCVVVLLLSCYFFIVRNIRSQEEKMELTHKAMTLETSNTLIALNQSNLEQMHKIRHDIKNRFAVMQIMLDNEEYARLKEYFKELLGETIVPYFQVNTGNSAFDLVFNLELSKAKAQGIEVTHKLVVPPTISVTENDLDGIVVNLMDNAVEACQKVKDKRKQIDVNVQIVHNYLVMRIANTLPEERSENALSLETDKPDKEFHGFGSKIVDDIAKKYNGHVMRSIDEDKFVVDVMLDLSNN